MGEGHQPREELEKTKEAEVVKVHRPDVRGEEERRNFSEKKFF